jgi:hypothetical protein
MNLKEIREYIPQAVRDYAWKEAQMNSRYVGWLDVCDGELFVRVYAFRETKSYGFQIREVIRENIEDLCNRDMYWTGCAGWKVVYKPERKQCNNWYGYNYYSIQEEDFGIWSYVERCGVYYTILNLEKLYEGKYKYCGYQHGNLFEYLRAYEKDPKIEFFGKIGMNPSKSLVKKCEKDKEFARFLWQNKDDYFTPKALIYAYDHHIDCKMAQEIVSEKARAIHFKRGFSHELRGKKVDEVKIYRYCETNRIEPWIYRDYLKAINYLGLDFNDTKNLFPKDFRRMHDLRADEYASKKARENAKEAKKLNEAFKEKNKEYKALEFKKGKYCVLLPNGIRDLKTEGSKLHHCVGKMGYDKKVVDGKSIIAFVRIVEEQTKPYVTVEYDIKRRKIVQCYGDHDSNPGEEVKKFTDKWEEYVRKNFERRLDEL